MTEHEARTLFNRCIVWARRAADTSQTEDTPRTRAFYHGVSYGLKEAAKIIKEEYKRDVTVLPTHT